ncbi:MAG TPA: acyl-CoA dehydrogenase family protein [Cryobacterium sp.]|nr:acyl-CoA dehydrogenase family protein [Cryobacterium sp.]
MTLSILRRHGAATGGASVTDPGSAARTSAEDREAWFARADAVADALAVDVRERDAANAPPFAEVELLRGAGLLPLTIPARHGGAGIDWPTAFELVQRIARVDNSIGQLLGYHYIFQAFAYVDLSPERSRVLAADTLRGRWLYSSTGTPQGPQAHARPVDGGYLVNGRKPFSTGSRVADQIYGRVTLQDGSRLAVLIDTASAGVIRHDDWDVLGSRLTATNTIEFQDVFVPDSAVIVNLGVTDADREPHQVLTTPTFQLLFAHCYLAAAEGAVIAAREYTREQSRPWFHSDSDAATGDPFIQNHYGRFVAQLQALAAVTDQAATALDWAWRQGEALTAADRAGVAEQIAAAKITAHHTSLEVTAAIYDVIGARAAGTRYGFDRYWRDVRTHTLHDPVAWKLNELGRYFLTDTAPGPSAYR